ncbi:MAG: response regulator [Bacteroidales bacterium]
MKRKILIADDSIAVQSFIGNYLEVEDDFEILTASCGKETYEKSITQVPELILMDHDMPDVKGIGTLRALKKNKVTSHIPVIIMTASNKIKEAFENGATDYIKKPFDKSELLVRIKNAIELVNSFRKIERQQEAITIQRDHIQRQYSEIKQQRDFLVKRKEEITDSLFYAKRIQKALLTPRKIINMYFPDHFIINRPMDIVSGDFYWSRKHGDKIMFVVADCTGHGVPGAFMSILGISFLNEIINAHYSIHPGKELLPSEVLGELRIKVIQALRQTGSSKEPKDGMDISLVIADIKTGQLRFAGGLLPLYVLKKDGLLEIKGDSFPIGFLFDIEVEFTNHELQIEPDDVVYMFSDGYRSQFGGERGKKFGSKRFKKLLESFYKLPLKEQKFILDKALMDWQGSDPQNDDILVTGFRYKSSYQHSVQTTRVH